MRFPPRQLVTIPHIPFLLMCGRHIFKFPFKKKGNRDLRRHFHTYLYLHFKGYLRSFATISFRYFYFHFESYPGSLAANIYLGDGSCTGTILDGYRLIINQDLRDCGTSVLVTICFDLCRHSDRS